MTDNIKRVRQARKTLEHYAEITGASISLDVEAVVTDLMADLLHFAQAAGMNPEAMQRRAMGHMKSETAR